MGSKLIHKKGSRSGGDPWDRPAFPVFLAKVPSFPNQSNSLQLPWSLGSLQPLQTACLPLFPTWLSRAGAPAASADGAPRAARALHAHSLAGMKPLQAPPTLTWEQSSGRLPRGRGAPRERRKGARRRIKGNMEGEKGRGGPQAHPPFSMPFKGPWSKAAELGLLQVEGFPLECHHR